MFRTLNKAYEIVQGYGRRRLLIVLAITVLNGIVTSLGVSAFFPFLSFASDPNSARHKVPSATVREWIFSWSDQDLVIASGTMVLFMVILSNLTQLTTTYVSSHYAQGFGIYLRMRVLSDVLSRNYVYFLSSSSGVLLKKVNGDTASFVNNIVFTSLGIVSGSLNIVFVLTALLVVNPLAVIVVSVALLFSYGALFWVLRSFMTDYSETMLMGGRSTNKLMIQILAVVKNIKIHHAEQYFLSQFRSYLHQVARVQLRQRVVSLLPRSVLEPIAIGSFVIVVVVGFIVGSNVETFLPTVGVFALAAYRILPNGQNLYKNFTTLFSNRYIIDELHEELIFREAELNLGTVRKCSDESRQVFSDSLVFRNVDFEYPNSGKKVISSANYEIRKNSSVAIIGGSGCGKSTLIDLIVGLYRPTSGDILLDGEKITEPILRRWQAKIGYVPQEVVLVDCGVAENVAFGCSPAEINWKRLRESAAAAQILEFIECELAEGWNTKLGERGIRLSGGQKQRIGIARALYRRPELLVLDEATSALDHNTESEIMRSVRALEGKMTMVIVAHRMSTIEWCEHVIDFSSEGNQA